MDELQPLYLAGYTLVILGLIGSVVPFLPGPCRICLGGWVGACLTVPCEVEAFGSETPSDAKQYAGSPDKNGRAVL